MPADLGQHFRAIWARKFHVLALSLLVGGVAYLLSSQQDAEYQASIRLRLAPGEVASGQRVSENETAFLATTYAELASGDAVLAPAAEVLDLSIGRVRSATDVSDARTAGFIDVWAWAGSPERAAEIATAVADALVQAVELRQQEASEAALAPIQDRLDEVGADLDRLADDDPDRAALQTRYDALLQALISRQVRAVDQLEIVSPARSASTPVSPRPRRDATLAFFVAFVVNAELAVLLGALGDRLSRDDLAEDIRDLTGLPLLARVPVGDRTETVEAFRELRTNLQFMGGHRRMATVAVVGADPGIGKTLTAINLGRSVASAGRSVVVVDADLRRPSIHERLMIDRSPGLSDFLRDPRTQVVRSAPPGEPESLNVLTSGSPVADPSDRLTARLQPLVEKLGSAELTVFDTPPLGLFADGLAIASQCDVTIVVVDVRSTKRRALKATVERLRQVGADVVGVVANRTDDVHERAYYDVAAKEVESGRRRLDRLHGTSPRAEPDPAGSQRGTYGSA